MTPVPGEIINRWSSDLIPPPLWDSLVGTAYGAPSYNTGEVGYMFPPSLGLSSDPDLVPVQLPNPAINDLLVETVSITIGIGLVQTAGGSRPSPSAITGGVGYVMQNHISFLSVPLGLQSWGWFPSNPYLSVFTLTGTLTPVNPFPVYQSDRYQLRVSFLLGQPIPQDGGGAAPSTGTTQMVLIGTTRSSVYGITQPGGSVSKLSFIGTQTAKGGLF